VDDRISLDPGVPGRPARHGDAAGDLEWVRSCWPRPSPPSCSGRGTRSLKRTCCSDGRPALRIDCGPDPTRQGRYRTCRAGGRALQGDAVPPGRV